MEEQAKEFFQNFTRQELIEVLYLQRAALVDDTTLFLSLLFGFIAVAYFVGDRLSALEKNFISTLYSLVMLVFIFAIFDMAQAVMMTSHALVGVDTSFKYFPPVICFLAWASSIWFMYRSRVKRGDT